MFVKIHFMLLSLWRPMFVYQCILSNLKKWRIKEKTHRKQKERKQKGRVIRRTTARETDREIQRDLGGILHDLCLVWISLENSRLLLPEATHTCTQMKSEHEREKKSKSKREWDVKEPSVPQRPEDVLHVCCMAFLKNDVCVCVCKWDLLARTRFCQL